MFYTARIVFLKGRLQRFSNTKRQYLKCLLTPFKEGGGRFRKKAPVHCRLGMKNHLKGPACPRRSNRVKEEKEWGGEGQIQRGLAKEKGAVPSKSEGARERKDREEPVKSKVSQRVGKGDARKGATGGGAKSTVSRRVPKSLPKASGKTDRAYEKKRAAKRGAALKKTKAGALLRQKKRVIVEEKEKIRELDSNEYLDDSDMRPTTKESEERETLKKSAGIQGNEEEVVSDESEGAVEEEGEDLREEFQLPKGQPQGSAPIPVKKRAAPPIIQGRQVEVEGYMPEEGVYTDGESSKKKGTTSSKHSEAGVEGDVEGEDENSK